MKHLHLAANLHLHAAKWYITCVSQAKPKYLCKKHVPTGWFLTVPSAIHSLFVQFLYLFSSPQFVLVIKEKDAFLFSLS